MLVNKHMSLIELYISTHVETTPKKITEILSQHKVECQVTENFSSVRDLCSLDSKMIVEHGFYIKIFNIPSICFKDRVWEILKPYLSISCAFVKYDNKYMGCVLNWPTIFRKSECMGCE